MTGEAGLRALGAQLAPGTWVSAARRRLTAMAWTKLEAGVTAGALALAAGVLMAEGPEAPARPREAPASDGSARPLMGTPETLYGFYIGAPYTYPSEVRIEKPGGTDLAVPGVNWDARPFKSPIYYGLRALRWQGSGPFGAMLDFTHSKTIAQREQAVRMTGTRDGRPVDRQATIGDLFRHLEFSHGHNMLTANGLVRLGAMLPGVRPYIGAGAGVALPHTEIQLLDEERRTYEYQYAGQVGQALAGIEIRLPAVTLFVEYKFTLARMDAPLTGNDSRGWGVRDLPDQLMRWFRGEATAGRARTTLVSHQVIGGVAARTPGGAAAAP